MHICMYTGCYKKNTAKLSHMIQTPKTNNFSQIPKILKQVSFRDIAMCNFYQNTTQNCSFK